MDQYTQKIYNLSIETERSKNVSSKCFSTKASFGKDTFLGRIFGFVSIESGDEKIPDFINFIIDQIKSNYYSFSPKVNENEILVTGNINVEEALEKALQKTNIDIFAYLEKEKMTITLKDIHILVVVSKDHEIIFSLAGKINSYLFHLRKNGSYQIVNVFENLASIQNEINPLKFFTQTIYGQIRENDFMFFCTSNILDYLSLEKIKTIVTQNEPSDTGRYFKTMLSAIEMPKHFVFSTISLQKNAISSRPAIPSIGNFDYEKAASKDSIKKLANSEKATERLLNPSLKLNFKKYTSALQSSFLNYLNDFKSGTLSKLAVMKKKQTLRSNVSEKNQIKKNYLNTDNDLFGKILKNKNIQKIFQHLIDLAQKIFQAFIRLPKKTKIVSITSIILFFLLIQSVIHLSAKNEERKEQKALENTLENIQKMQDAAEASIVYQDEDAARNLYLKASQELNNIPEKKKNSPDIIQMTQTIEQKLEELRHMENIKEPTILGNWKNLDPKSQITQILLYGKNLLFGYNSSKSLINTLDVNTHILGSILSPIKNMGEITLGTTYKNSLLLMNNDQTLFTYDLNNNDIRPTPITIREGSKISSIQAYGNTVYALDPRNNQVIKYTATNAGLTSPKDWIHDDIVEIHDAIDMAIDGNIYILKSHGEVIRLLNGKLTTFSIKSIDPLLSNPTKIFTNSETSYIYILDPENKRVVVVDKNGILVQQYASEKFDNLKNFIVLEKEKRIYVLNNTTVYGLSIK